MVKRPGSGFTLIELLVVMAIIGILAALLFPVFSTVQEQSRQNACIGNLQQIAVALKAYETDNSAFPPAPYFDGTRFQGGVSALYPNYITDKNIFICPDDALAQANSVAAKAVVYSSYNGMVNQNTWTFQTDGSGNPERLYNYFGYDNDGYDIYSINTYPPVTGTVFAVPDALPSLLAQGLTGRFYPRLMNQYAPDTTIVIHCPYHRSHYGTNPNQQMDVVLRLNGKTEKDNVAPMGVPDATGASAWVEQK
jgi:prepilin-type N-terminal cleavage/methylation domain-containing protein